MKIAVIGYSGSGKSTLAKYLGQVYTIPVLYLDTVQFLPGWRERERGEALEMVARFMNRDSWVIDGNYTVFLQKERLEQADKIIFMNFGRFTCLRRAYRRYRENRGAARESMADGCTEKLDAEFIWWILYRGRTAKRRRHYRRVAEQYRDKTVVLKNQRELDTFMRRYEFAGKEGKKETV